MEEASDEWVLVGRVGGGGPFIIVEYVQDVRHLPIVASTFADRKFTVRAATPLTNSRDHI